MTPYELFQLDFYGDILPTIHGTKEEEFENGKERQDREAEWTLANEDKILMEYEY